MIPMTAACRVRSAPRPCFADSDAATCTMVRALPVCSAVSFATRGPGSSTGTAGTELPPQSPPAVAEGASSAPPPRKTTTATTPSTRTSTAATRTPAPPARTTRRLPPAIAPASAPRDGKVLGDAPRGAGRRDAEVHAGAVGERDPDGAVVGRHQLGHDGGHGGPGHRRRRRRLEVRHQRGVDQVLHRGGPALAVVDEGAREPEGGELLRRRRGSLLLGGGDRHVVVVGAGGRGRDDGCRGVGVGIGY